MITRSNEGGGDNKDYMCSSRLLGWDEGADRLSDDECSDESDDEGSNSSSDDGSVSDSNSDLYTDSDSGSDSDTEGSSAVAVRTWTTVCTPPRRRRHEAEANALGRQSRLRPAGGGRR